MGTRRLYDFVHDNPMVELHPTEYVNDPFRIAQNDRMVAINSAIEVDLTGQVCADSIGSRFYSGAGGQVDFIYGASRSKGGKPIIALPSMATADGQPVSRIAPMLKPGAGVVTTRSHVHYIITEHGIADLYGKSVRQRARALIAVAHPDHRDALTAEVKRRDPEGTNAALRQMVVIGHSQGGLLVKSSVVDTGDRLWRVVSTNRLEDLKVTDAQRAQLRRMFFLEPLPFVKRVIFISTPHRGSYLSSRLARRLAQWFVSLPGTMVSHGHDLVRLTQGSEAGEFARGKLPTSLDGMSPKNPGLLVMADIPVAPGVKAHSIVSIDGKDQPPKGGDGVVKYTSAHVDYVESEFVVRSYHTCLDNPATIEEVRRILHEHLHQLPNP